jgi:hypothetical protein
MADPTGQRAARRITEAFLGMGSIEVAEKFSKSVHAHKAHKRTLRCQMDSRMSPP